MRWYSARAALLVFATLAVGCYDLPGGDRDAGLAAGDAGEAEVPDADYGGGGDVTEFDAGSDAATQEDAGADTGFEDVGADGAGLDGGDEDLSDGGEADAGDAAVDAGPADAGSDVGGKDGGDAGAGDAGADGGVDAGKTDTGAVDAGADIDREAAKIGAMYGCPLAAGADYLAGNLGYSCFDDEQIYATAKLLVEKGCLAGVKKYVTAYVATVNFPNDGAATGANAAMKRGWLDYWDRTVTRFSALGFEVIVHPSPFLVPVRVDGNTAPPGLAWLLRTDLNLPTVPAVYECRDGRKTALASIYDPATLAMGKTFYGAVGSFFGKYPAFTKISIVPPSDFGEYGFPFGVAAAWWAGTDNVGDCFLTGDAFARQAVPKDPPTYAQYQQKLNDFRGALTAHVKAVFPGLRYMLYLGYGNDDLPRDGFAYDEVVAYAVQNGIDIHSSHASGMDASAVPLDKIAANKPPWRREFTFENVSYINEYAAMKNISFAARYEVTGMELYPEYLFDHLFTFHLLRAAGKAPGGSLYSGKDIFFEDVGGLGAVRSGHLKSGWIDAPVDGGTINADAEVPIGGWAFYDPPYGDRLNYDVYVYHGSLYENSAFPADQKNVNPDYNVGSSGKLHPQFMRLVGRAKTVSERAIGLGDTSRFGALFKPRLASGKSVLRIYLENTGSGILAEHPSSPIVLTTRSRISGSYHIDRQGFLGDSCSREFRLTGTITDAKAAGAPVEVAILDEYRGRVLARGATDGAGAFDIRLSVADTPGEETQMVSFRAYAWTDVDGDGAKELVGLPLDMSKLLSSTARGYDYLGNKFFTVLDCP